MIFDKPFDFDRFVRLLLGVFVVVGVYFLLDKLSAVLIPFFAAWLTAYLLEPIVGKVQRLLKRRVLSVLLTLTALFLSFVLLMILFIPAIAEEIESLKELLTSQLSNLEWPGWIPQDMAIQLNGFLNNLQWQDVIAQEAFTDKAVTALTSVWDLMSSVVGVVGALFGIVTYVLYLVFLMLDYDKLSKDWQTLLPEKFKGFVVQLANDMEEGMNGYFRAQTKIVVCVAILFAVGFKIIGLPFAISLGIVLGLMNYIPYAQLLGIIPAIGLAALHALQTQESFWMMLVFVLLVFTLVQLVQDILLTPYFMGAFSGFNPAIILLSLSIWGSLLGVVGIIIAIPLTSIVLAYYKRYILKH
ncbi:MAG: AI-2E family transporter [Flavobacteriales bacterium]|nr:AI-2E family transporter [Flavobacteriales bacterium]